MKIKTLGELNKEGKEAHCRGCYKKEVECLTCFWQTEKWVPWEEAQKEILNLKGEIVDLQKEVEHWKHLSCEKSDNYFELKDKLERELEQAKQEIRELQKSEEKLAIEKCSYGTHIAEANKILDEFDDPKFGEDITEWEYRLREVLKPQ